MRPFVLAAILGLTLLGVGAGDRASAAPPQVDRSGAGRPMPAASFLDRQGKPHSLAELRGKPTIVNLWATWCAPCKAEMPALDRFAARNRGKVNVVAVAQDIQGWRAVDKVFAPGRFAALPVYLDQPTALVSAYKAVGLPVTVAYDAAGKELWRVDGPIEWDKPAATKALGF